MSNSVSCHSSKSVTSTDVPVFDLFLLFAVEKYFYFSTDFYFCLERENTILNLVSINDSKIIGKDKYGNRLRFQKISNYGKATINVYWTLQLKSFLIFNNLTRNLY